MAESDFAAMRAELDRLKAENAQLKAGKVVGPKPLTFKVSEKGALSVYGLNARFPVTLYKTQWQRLFERVEDLNKFIEDNNDSLADTKPEKTETKKKEAKK